MDNKLLIIGNGFDLDLGLKTSYSSFIESKHFTPLRHKYELIENLCENTTDKKWIDIEEFLKKFSFKNGDRYSTMQESKEAFNLITKAFYLYLKEIDYSTINKDSIASKLIKSVINNGYFKILNFNYTNIHKIIEVLKISPNIENKHIHGSIQDDSIILGFEDNANVSESCYFMIKSHSPHYRSCNVRAALDQADEIIIFGHSLGSTDYHYFSDFFKNQSGLNGGNVKSKKIRIFTYNENSRLELLKQLREMNEKRINYLYDLNDLLFYKTSDPANLGDIEKYLQELNECSKKNMING